MYNRHIFDLLLFKTAANLKAEVSRYYLNYLWWVIEPALLMAVFYVIFGVVLDMRTEHFAAFLLTGLTFWNWFNRTVSNASGSILTGGGLMLQVNIPKAFFPLEVFFRDGFKHLFVVGLLLVFLVFYPTPVYATWLTLPVLLLVQGAFVLAVSIFCAALVPFIPDLRYVISTAMTLLFFGSGIFFDIEGVVLPEHEHLLFLNPMAGLVKSYRDILVYGQYPDWFYILKVLLFSIGLLWFSLKLVQRFEYTYPRICQ